MENNRSKSDFITYAIHDVNSKNNEYHQNQQKKLEKFNIDNSEESQNLEMTYMNFQEDDTSSRTEKQQMPLLPEHFSHSYSCNFLPEKQQVEEEEREDSSQKDSFQNSINMFAKQSQSIASTNGKQKQSTLDFLKKSNSIQQDQHPQMDFQKIRSILYELQQDEIDNNGVQVKENQYRKLFTYGRESDLQWKDQNLQHPSQAKHLRIATLTWNLHGSCPLENLSEIIAFLKQASHHIVVIGTQECERSIAASFFYSSKSKWEQAILDNMSQNYVKVQSLKMNALHLIVLSHKTLRPYIKNVQSDKRATGIGNYLGNKGGLGISFDIGKRSYLFVNLHLSSGKDNIERRNKDFLSVENNLNLGKRLSNADRCHQERVSNRFDYVFFIGDMNYRINVDIGQKDINEHDYIQFLLHDQLLQEVQLIATDFKEGMITFPPTYKMDSTQHKFYTGKKKRQPAWTDRVLYKSFKPNTMFQISYDSNTNIMGSDHRPVYAQFLVQHLLSSADDQHIKY